MRRMKTTIVQKGEIIRTFTVYRRDDITIHERNSCVQERYGIFRVFYSQIDGRVHTIERMMKLH